NPGLLVTLMGSILDTIENWAKAGCRLVREVVSWIVEWIYKRLAPSRPISHPGSGWIDSLQILLYVLLAVVVCTLAVVLLRNWQRRKSRCKKVEAEPVLSAPDLADESVGADQLPEESWLKLAQETAERGQLRLALRAFYLAGLARLSRRELIR